MSAEETVAAAVRAYLAQRQAHLGKAAPLPEDADLFDEGVLDSVAITELIDAVEKATGREIDFIDVDPDELATVAGIVSELTEALA